MKCLYYTIGFDPQLPENQKSDYLSDQLFLGLRELFGVDVVDFPRKDYLYKDYGDSSRLWGAGFSYSKIIDDVEVDRDAETLETNIRNNFYDILILSMHHTAHQFPRQKMLYNTLEYLQNLGIKSKIIITDGNDERNWYQGVFDYNLDTYLFKREIPDSLEDQRVRPISFAIPTCKVLKEVPKKDKIFSTILPCDHHHPNRKTHGYTDEKTYYAEYQSSWFALNCCKGGWATSRLLEIMGNACIPIFCDLELCPSRTLVNLPKKELLAVKEWSELIFKKKCFNKNEITDDCILFDENEWFQDKRHKEVEWFLDYTRKNLTTEALAHYVLREVGL